MHPLPIDLQFPVRFLRALLASGQSRTPAMIGAASAVGALVLHGLAIPIWRS